MSSGCAWTKWNQRELTAFGPKAPCRVPPHATAEELVEHLNQNVEKIHGWHAGRVKLRANNMPLGADIAVERDRHLRILVTSAVGHEMDVGCNDEVFWFWAKRNPQPAVLYARHEQLDEVRESLQIPFEPGWLMEALGVARIPLEGTVLEPIGQNTSRLVSHHTSPNGRTIRKAITVDTCHGRVLEHSVWESNGRRIAHATFSNHRIDPGTGALLAHHIQLDWPQADVSLTMDLGTVDVNPSGLPETIWELPSMRNYPLINLEDVAQRGGKRPPRHSQASAEETLPRRSRAELNQWQAHREAEPDEFAEDQEEMEPAEVDAGLDDADFDLEMP